MKKEEPNDLTDYKEVFQMDDEKITQLKLEINNLIWMNCPEETTIKEAEMASLDIMSIILNANNRKELSCPE